MKRKILISEISLSGINERQGSEIKTIKFGEQRISFASLSNTILEKYSKID